MTSQDFRKMTMELTKELVKIPSINGVPGGEKEIGKFIEKKLREIPYFQKHPKQVFLQPLEGDKLGRVNVIAVVLGSGVAQGKTIILHAHMDTVGVEDYGRNKEYAFSCDQLPEKIREMTDDAEVLEDLDSGDWMFGRGAADMKCGIAVNYGVLYHILEHPERLKGNIIFMCNPVEENQHTGIRRAVPLLQKMKKERGFQYLMAINTDYTSPEFKGDTTHYFHAGAVGKLLPGFYCIGKETHAGEAYEGFSVSRILAELVERIDCRASFCDEYYGEVTSPPVVLKLEDLKSNYNVQTPGKGWVYFNYMVHKKNVDEILEELIQIAEEALKAVKDFTDGQYQEYCSRAGIPYKKLETEYEVYDYASLVKKTEGKSQVSVKEKLRKMAEEEQKKGTDAREISRKIVEKLCEICDIHKPCIVVFFAPPYCPRNTLFMENEKERELFESIEKFLREQESKRGEKLELRHFFPALTDSSYLKIDDSSDSIKKLTGNFPAMEEIFPVDVEAAKDLNIPAFNFGCLGKDAHKWTERVNIPYTFEILPEIIADLIEHYLL